MLFTCDEVNVMNKTREVKASMEGRDGGSAVQLLIMALAVDGVGIVLGGTWKSRAFSSDSGRGLSAGTRKGHSVWRSG
jgi:hypothetical protein